MTNEAPVWMRQPRKCWQNLLQPVPVPILETYSDPNMLPKEFSLYYASDVERLFGASFVRDLLQVEPGKWTGPVWSSYGLHLVFVRERIEGRDPELSEVREEVEREWTAKRRREFKEETYKKAAGALHGSHRRDGSFCS